MMEQDETPVAPGVADPRSGRMFGPNAERRSLRWLLVASLALNLLVLGVVAGGMIRNGGFGPPRGIDLQLGPIVQALSPADRQTIRADLRGRADLHQQPRRDRDAMLVALLQALRADPFDPNGIEGLLRDQHDRTLAIQTAGQAALLSRIGLMSPEARHAFADRLEVALGRRHADDE